jgi:hypothetical protein
MPKLLAVFMVICNSINLYACAPMKFIATLVLSLIASSAQAAGSFADLPRYMPAGGWRILYDRQAKAKLPPFKKSERGTSEVCIGADPRTMIHEWFGERHCDIERETMIGKSWRMNGECRLKWTKKPVPIDVEITLADGKSFVMNTRTPHGAFLDFQEHATVTRVAPSCPGKPGGG